MEKKIIALAFMAINFIVMTSCINEPVDISDNTYIYRLIENTAYAKASQVKKNIIDYYTESNQPEKALKMIAAILPEYSKKDTISINYTHLLRNKAYSLANTGRYKEAIQLYEHILLINDSLIDKNAQTQALLIREQNNERQFTIDKQKSILHSQQTTIIIISILLILLFILSRITICYHKILKDKNRKLFKKIKIEERVEKLEEKEVLCQSKAILSPAENIYRKLCELMEEDKIFSETELNRTKLAKLIGTNHCYIDDAIKQCSGKSTKEFIDNYRLRYAAQLLSEDKYNISMIAELCGYRSRGTFTRLFKERYGMSPTEYRTISQEEK
jgi:AraC-like DNA-binding protein